MSLGNVILSKFIKPGGGDKNGKIKAIGISIEECFDKSYECFPNKIFYYSLKVDF